MANGNDPVTKCNWIGYLQLVPWAIVGLWFVFGNNTSSGQNAIDIGQNATSIKANASQIVELKEFKASMESELRHINAQLASIDNKLEKITQ